MKASNKCVIFPNPLLLIQTQRTEEEPYTCARSCGCPSSFDWHERKWQDIVTWIKSNRVEWLAGITTGLTAVPTAVAFAILAGVAPSVGLRGTWIIMLVMSLFGGKDDPRFVVLSWLSPYIGTECGVVPKRGVCSMLWRGK